MNVHSDNILIKKIDVASDRIHSLYQNTAEVARNQPLYLDQCLEELGAALEELYTAEEELRQSTEELEKTWAIAEQERRRYQELFELAPDAYLVTDIFGRIEEANQVAAKLFNIPHQYLTGKLLINFVSESERRNFRAVLNELAKVNRVQEWELDFYPRNSAVFYGSITVGTVRNSENEIIGFRWLIRDITSRKQAEEQLRQVQLQNLDLIEADRLKSQFMSTISHELRTPLNAILGFSQLLMMRLPKKENELLTTFVERIFRNGKNLLALIEDLLDFTKLESHCLQLHPEQFDLVGLANSTCEELGVLAKQKGLDLQVNLAQPQLLIVHDSHRMRQILVNLLSNAIKFTDQGSITLEIGELSPERVTLMVKDTGIGIDSDHLPHVFREFWQVNQSITRKCGGTGLGLAITQALVKLMQGKITVESRVGEGTTFRVEIPRIYEETSCSSMSKITP